MSIDLSQFFQVFFDETEEHLLALETLLLGVDRMAPVGEDLNAIFRAVHSIKGGSATFGFNDMTEVAHVLENLLDRVRKREIILTEEMINAFLEAGDVLRMQLAFHRGQGSVDPDAVQGVQEKLTALASTVGSDSNPIFPVEHASVSVFSGGIKQKVPEPVVQNDPGYGFFDEGQDFFESIREVKPEPDLGYGFFVDPVSSAEVFPVPSSEPVGAGQDSVGSGVKTDPVPERVSWGRRAADRVGTDPSIRVKVEKVDQLINLVGELIITQSMLMQASGPLEEVRHESMKRALGQLERNSRDLQEAILSVRMLPISVVFNRFPRLVRDLAGKMGKQVELKMLGEGTELDKGLIEKISDPLMHLIRNSVDHGIEMPERRHRLHKPSCGMVTLNAYHQGGAVVIEVSDDGGGLPRDKILSKAREQGLPCHDAMTDAEVWNLIFEPGFSTTDQITEVSGRGVGMDVVKRNIHQMGGRIEIDSTVDLGMRTIIRLPLTLAILDGLLVAVGEQVYVLPLISILESVPLTSENLRTISGDGRLLQVRGEYVPLVVLGEKFPVPGDRSLFPENPPIAVIVEAEGHKVAVCVDALLGQQQVVIKSLETHFRRLVGISGATILGDGRVALIVDPAPFVHESRFPQAGVV
ncbi:fused chemotactic sensory histidine kinase in two-component regulatory system with CheB and CheY: sensory histidine kinase; signal sensing protein [mine drainage metagenome]|uniref:Chemotaxis protein CheA n=1 Tax=mine drainage metagenome TaxID=410659 RepID=A0A3P3ZMF1_9ZZZZ